MEFRLAQRSDIAACAALDASYSSEYSWQLTSDEYRAMSDERPRPRDSSLIAHHSFSVGLRLVKLPRPRSVIPPEPTAELAAEWDHTDFYLIAEEDDLMGYLCAAVRGDAGWVERIVVHQPYRRSGVAAAMLAAARGWAEGNGLRCLFAAAPTKNHPAVALFHSSGYRICGYNERHYANGEIALYLAQDLRRG